jgi:hypothetical protein
VAEHPDAACPARAWRARLCDFLEARHANGDVAIHTKNGSTWAQPPAKPQIRDGALVKDETGKVQ